MYENEKERYIALRQGKTYIWYNFRFTHKCYQLLYFLFPDPTSVTRSGIGTRVVRGEELLVTALRNPKDYMRTQVAKTAFVLKSQTREHFLWEEGLLSYIAKSGGRPLPQCFGPYSNILALVCFLTVVEKVAWKKSSPVKMFPYFN